MPMCSTDQNVLESDANGKHQPTCTSEKLNESLDEIPLPELSKMFIVKKKNFRIKSGRTCPGLRYVFYFTTGKILLTLNNWKIC